MERDCVEGVLDLEFQKLTLEAEELSQTLEVANLSIKHEQDHIKMLTDHLLGEMLKNKTGSDDKAVLNDERDCLETVINYDIVTGKSIIAAMKTWCVTHADEDFVRVERMMMKGKKVMNIKTVIEAHGEALALSPLHAAAMFGSTEILKLCMNFEGVDVNLKFGNIENPLDAGNLLDLALQVGNPDIINCVFENAKDSELVTVEKGIPLCLADAVMNSEAEIVELLLNKESFHPSLNPLMCLMLAIQDKNLAIFTQILPQAKAMARLNSTLPNLPCPLCPAPAITVLHLAICSYSPRMVKLLVQAGCDVNDTKGQLEGYTPLMQAIAKVGNHCCRGKCEDRVISELLCAEQINLDLQVEDKGKKITSHDLVNNYTCPSIRKMIEQAYARNNLRKKMLKRRENRTQADKSKASSSGKPRRERICWYCSTTQQLLRCASCRVAWYCGDECQGEDWDVHGDWCVKKGEKRKAKREAEKSKSD